MKVENRVGGGKGRRLDSGFGIVLRWNEVSEGRGQGDGTLHGEGRQG